MSQHVLVTGHQGYIGSVLVPKLVRAGYTVTGVDAGYFDGLNCGPWPEEYGDVRQIRADVRDIDESALRGVDAVMHLAALSNDPMGKLNPELTDEINHRASVRLAQLAKEAGVARFLFSSSCSLYGASEQEAPLTEEAAFNPVTAYGRSKVDAERNIAPLADETFSPVFLRNATAYGFAPRLRADLVVQDLVGSAMFTGNVEVLSDGTPWRPLVHVEDIALAFMAALEAPREAIHNRAFNIGRNGENYTIAEVAQAVKDAVPDSRVVYAPGGGPDKRSYRVDFTTAANDLPGFEPRWTLAEGIRQVAYAYRTWNVRLGELRGERFTRLARLQQLLDASALDGQLRWRVSEPVSAAH